VSPSLGKFADWIWNTAIPAIADFEHTVGHYIRLAVNWIGSLWTDSQPSLEEVGNKIHNVAGTLIRLSERAATYIPLVVGFVLALWAGTQATWQVLENKVIDVADTFVGLYNAAKDKIGAIGGFF